MMVIDQVLGLGRPASVRWRLADGNPRQGGLAFDLAPARSIQFGSHGQAAELPLRGGKDDGLPGGQELMLERLRTLLAPPPRPSVQWTASLLPFQQDGVAALVHHECLLLADDMGLGKTVQSIAALRLLARGAPLRALVVVPAGLVAQWRHTLRTWAPELRVSTVRGGVADRAWQWEVPADVFLVSYETLRSDAATKVSPPRRRAWDVVVLDEAQKIKNASSDVSRACKLIPRRRAWALSGTPLENRIEDLASICEFLQPYESGPIPRLRPGIELIDLHRSLQLRRRKVDVLTELPPKSVFTIDIELPALQRRAYERAKADGIVQLRALGPEVRVSNVLELIGRLKQLCNVDPVSGESAKLEDLRERVAAITDQGDRALVFSQYANNDFGAGFIARGLREFKPLQYTGSLTADERELVIQGFRHSRHHRALILSLRAGGQGLNLQEASYVVHFDRWWNPAVERQAEDRTHRMGQTNPVTVYAYRCVDTVEERIDVILQGKQSLFERLVDDVTLELSELLSKEDLLGLFGLRWSD
jgi:SNF2 family DNA or RNA helicase